MILLSPLVAFSALETTKLCFLGLLISLGSVLYFFPVFFAWLLTKVSIRKVQTREQVESSATAQTTSSLFFVDLIPSSVLVFYILVFYGDFPCRQHFSLNKLFPNKLFFVSANIFKFENNIPSNI